MHELRNPLVTLGNYLGLLESDVTSGHLDRFAEHLRVVREATGEIGQRIDELFRYSHSTGRQEQ